MTKEEKLEICNKVILHWWENLFLAYAEDLQPSDLNLNKCEFCVQFNTGCAEDFKFCPISHYTGQTLCYGTNYHYFFDSECNFGKDGIKLIKLVSEMLIQLEEICDKWLSNE
jgi:hypothetical protein